MIKILCAHSWEIQKLEFIFWLSNNYDWLSKKCRICGEVWYLNKTDVPPIKLIGYGWEEKDKEKKGENI